VFTVSELAARVGGVVVGDGALRVEGVSALEDAGPGQCAFFANPKYHQAFAATRAGVVVVEPTETAADGRTLIRVKNAYLAFARISTLFHPPQQARGGVAAEAFVHPTARVDASAEVMPLAYVGPGATVGARAVLYPGVFVGEGARIGDDCLLYPNVVVRERCVVGQRVILQPGVVLGGDGFGFAFDMEGEGRGPRHYKVPQAGNVVVEDDVEIGANTCVDRATLGSTVIGRGAKIDNLVQIAHNVRVGPLCLLVAQVGIAGSTRIGAGVVAAGQVGIVGHVEIGDRATLGAQAGVMNDVPAGEMWSGTPARPHREWLKTTGHVNKLSDLAKQVRELQKELKELRAEREKDRQ
jgi:UDP-3-O-[3-hydroxymyristoyl] glucosamine N-acyltransferase